MVGTVPTVYIPFLRCYGCLKLLKNLALAMKFNFQVPIPGNYYTSEHRYPEDKEFLNNITQKYSTSGYCYTIVEVSLLLGNVTRRFSISGDLLTGGFSISGYYYLEIPSKKLYFREYLCGNENIFENISGG